MTVNTTSSGKIVYDRKAKWPKTVTGMEIPIYGGKIVLCNTQEEFEACHAWSGIPRGQRLPGGGTCSQLIISNEDGSRRGRPIYLVGVFDGSTSTLAHEIAHACFFILEDVGIEITQGGSNEAFCYLLQDLLINFTPDLKVPV